MSTVTTIDSRITDAEPYKGDDWAQHLASIMAAPLFLMGLMAVLASLGLGIAGGVNVSDFFGGVSHPLDHLGRSQVLGQLTGAAAFLGMGLIIGGIVLYLVNIVRSLRDAGRDVQQSLGAQALKLRKPWSGRITPHVMMMGVMAEVAAFIVGIMAAVRIGEVHPGAIANTATANATQLAHIGFVTAATAWLPGLRFVGLAVLLSSVVLVLLTIQKTLGFQARRVTEIADRSTSSEQARSLGSPARHVDSTESALGASTGRSRVPTGTG